MVLVSSLELSNLFKGLIDALEFFAGIVIFSDSKAEEKIRCKSSIYPKL
jgi:hypothetical protein